MTEIAIEASEAPRPGAGLVATYPRSRLTPPTGQPVDAILVSLSLTKLLLRSDRRSEVRKIAEWMKCWSTHLGREKLAQAAVNEFVSTVLSGEITVISAGALQRRIEKAGTRRSRCPHSR